MENEVKQAIYIGIQLMLTATVIGIIATTLYFGKALVTVREREKFSGNLIAQQNQFNNYMNKQGEIVGSDVVDIMLTYSRVYNFAVVDRSSGSVRTVMYRLTGDDLDSFRTEKLTTELRDKLFDKFKMQQILTSDGHAILGLVFTTGGTAACTPQELEQIKRDVFKLNSNISYK